METKKNMYMNKFYKTNPRGISLIVLVITIIVIIILATAIIISILQNQPLSEANKARFQSDRDNMQSIFTNTVAKVMAEKQSAISIKAGVLNETKSGVSKTTGVASYTLENSSSGTITFDNKDNTETSYYTGKRLPIYKAGETTWYVDDEGILTLRVGNTEYVSDGSTINKGEGTGVEVLPPLKTEVGEIVKTSAKEYEDEDGRVATVPIGFAVVPGKDVIKEGLVISDVANDINDEGNQFVWIPVEDMSTFKREVGYSNGAIQTSSNGVIDFAKCEEPYNNATESERKEYENMMKSVEEYKGFYIGRYEISQKDDGSGSIQVKKGKNPLVNITWGISMINEFGGIVSLARNMYPYREELKKGNIVSTLIYGTAWDETIRFLKTNEKYKNIDKDSTGFGNLATNKVELTGSNEKYCLNNIYDFAGNVWEWTMETYKGQSTDASLGRIPRGGGFYYYDTVSFRGHSTSTTNSDAALGGRVQLYIK